MRFRSIVPLFVLFAGCGEDQSGLTQGQFIQERAKAVCAGIIEACGMTEQTCVALRVAEYQAAYQIELSKAHTFVPANADKCISKTKDAYGKIKGGTVALSAADYLAMETTCANVYRGVATTNGSCQVDVDCLNDLICDKGYCGTYKLVSEVSGCANIGETCPPGYYCSTGAGVWMCAVRVGLQGGCIANIPCMEELRCAGGLCLARLGTGEACLAHSDCTSGFCEPYLRKCMNDIRFGPSSPVCIAMGGV
jgi:hypothetical protein